jgi:hypothetical protein
MPAKTKLIPYAIVLLFIASGLFGFVRAEDQKIGAPLSFSEQEKKIEVEKRDWKTDETPSFRTGFSDRGFFKNIWSYASFPFVSEKMEVYLVSPDKKNIKLLKEKEDYSVSGMDIDRKIDLVPKSDFQPGQYELRIKMKRNKKEIVLSQNFSWGVLTINTNKSAYLPGEKAYLQMAVLDEGGHTLCDADLALTVKNSKSGEEKVFYTSLPLFQEGEGYEEGLIKKSTECGPETVTSNPDYFAYYDIPQKPGTYEMTLRAKTENGEHIIKDSFEVKENLPFEVERIGPTRIYPVASYEVKLKIKANQDFEGNITEEVPADFKIENVNIKNLDNENSFQILNFKFQIGGSSNGRKNLNFENINLKKDQQVELSYAFDAPDISPELFHLGPLKFTKQTEKSFWEKIGSWNFDKQKTLTVFQEYRQWQIASDAVANNGRLFYGDATDLGKVKAMTLTDPFTFSGSEIDTNISSTSNHIAYVISKAAPTRDEVMVGQLKVDGRLDIISGTSAYDAAADFSAQWNNPGTTPAMTCTGTPADCTRAFDIEYEALSGKAMVVYADNTNQKLYYCYYDGSSWGPVSDCTPTNGTNDISLFSNGRPVFVEMETKPNSNTILMGVSIDVSGTHEVEAFVWDGSSWGNSVVATDTTDASTQALDKGRVFDVVWDSPDTASVVYGTEDSNYEIKVKIFSSGSWSSQINMFNTYNGGLPVNVSTDNSSFFTVVADSLNDLSAVTEWCDEACQYWDQSSSIGEASLENQATGPLYADIASTKDYYNKVIFAQNAANTADPEYSKLVVYNTFPAIDSTIPTSGGTDDGTFAKLIPSPNSSKIMALFGDIDRNLVAQMWDGSAWQGSDSGALEADVSGATADNTIYYNLPADFSYIPYSPWSRNWRWSSDQSNKNPSTWLANANTAPQDIFSGDNLRLRFNFAELSGQGQENSRKKLEYTSGCTPNSSGGEVGCTWSNVGNSYFSYCDGPGTDDATDHTNNLSDSTLAGPFVENGTSASTFDHTALSVAEFDYCVGIGNSAAQNTTYYFRAYDNDQSSAIYRQQTASTSYTYPSLTTGIPVMVGTSGTQPPTLGTGTTANYVGGKFIFNMTSGTAANVTSITVSEQGTVDAQADLSNIKLYYETDTSAPYDCDSESYGGTENQFGSTASNFSAANGTAAFSGTSVGVGTTQALCIYTVLDVDESAGNGTTLEIEISSPYSDVAVSSGKASPSSAVAISGTTTLSAPAGAINQRQGIIENDQNGNNISNYTANVGERMRVKIQIDTGNGASVNRVFKLQYDKNDNSWQDVRPAGEIRPALSTVVRDKYTLGGPDAGTCKNGTTWSLRKGWNKFVGKAMVGSVYEGRAVTDAITLNANECDEMEFIVDTKNATAGTTYRFRLYNMTSNAELSNYSSYPTFTVVTSVNNTKRYSESNVTSLPSGTNPPDMKTFLDNQGYSNVNADDATREVLQNVPNHSGTNILTTDADSIMTGTTAAGQFGWSINKTNGDINGDGYADIVVGANGEAPDGSRSGRVYIFYGNSHLADMSANSADVILSGTGANYTFGEEVDIAGDVNGDGYSDVIVGNRGKVYIFYGGSNMSNMMASSAPVILTGESSSFGNTVSSAGDFNGDGYADVISGDDWGFYPYCRAYIFYGSPGMASMSAADAPVKMQGETDAGYFGHNVASAGDANGDGYSDVIVGAYWDPYSSSAGPGRAYVFFGSSTAQSFIYASSAPIIYTGNSAGSGFAQYAIFSGDVNGDGYSDVAVADPGTTYIFYGGNNMQSMIASSAPVKLSGLGNDGFGWSGDTDDINGDGYPDVILGAYADDAVATNAGRAYVFYGGPGLVSKGALSADAIFNGSVPSGSFGFDAASPGDVNGDGYKDIVISGYNMTNSSGVRTGRAYLYNMSYQGISTTGASSADKIITGNNTGTLGWSVSSAGDVNGDGYSDMIAGERGYSGNTGRAYIFYGNSSLNVLAGSASVVFTGNAAGDRFGNSVSSAGDVNGDGYDDIVIGSNANDSTSGANRAYIFYGSKSMTNMLAGSASVILSGNTAADAFGCSVASAGDVNGDGYADVIVGAYNAYATSSRNGRAYVFYGGSLGANISANSANVIITGSSVNDYLGFSVASAGDVDGDGYSDVIVGAYNASGGSGLAYIFNGGSGFVTKSAGSANVIYTGSYEGLGHSVASAGDVNGDGYSDVIMGALVGSNNGRAYIFYGSNAMTNMLSGSAPVMITGSAGGDWFGYYSVASAGDVNNDGYSDVVVGSVYAPAGTGAGRAYIFYGSPSISSKDSNSADIIISGQNVDDFFGLSVSSAGDVNSDGYSDVIVSAPGYISGAYNGRVYLYLGGGTTAYPVFNFANKSGSACSGLSSITATWNGQSSVGASTKHIFLQVYNFNTGAWETPTNGENSSLSANLDGDISVTLNSNLGYYCNGNNWSYWRAYQDSGNNILRSDYFTTDLPAGEEQPPASGNSYQIKNNTQMKGDVRFR